MEGKCSNMFMSLKKSFKKLYRLMCQDVDIDSELKSKLTHRSSEENVASVFWR